VYTEELILMIYFTSDLHFAHERIIKDFSQRDFKTIEEHDQHIYEAITEKFSP
jgi:calcineurin-like phosphoesterase family protein